MNKNNEGSKQPNVIIMMTDQQSSWTLGCYGGTVIDTPHVDRLAKEGALFIQFFTNSASCTPSRGCFMTGRYPQSNGAVKLNDRLNRDEITFAHTLRDAGYSTAYIGKWHLDGTGLPGWVQPEEGMGFEDNKLMINRTHRKKVIEKEGEYPILSGEIGDEKTFMTDWLTDRAIEYVKKPHEKPYCLMLSIPDPHHPFTVREPYSSMYQPAEMPIPETFYQKKLPDWAQQGTKKQNLFPFNDPKAEEQLRALKAQYCGQIKCIDDNVGKLLNQLEEQGTLDDTVVIFTTDHGEYMGEHRMLKKNNLYETAYRIPLVVRWPEKIKPQTQIDKVVTTVDFLPTLLGLLDVKTSKKEQGRDASAFLLNEQTPWRDEAYIHPNFNPRTGIFTKEYELAYVSEEYKDHVLFDRMNDPNQTENLFFNSDYREKVEELTLRIVEHHKQVGTDPEKLPRALSKYFYIH